ncbi:MazG-like family protein [Streptomyces triculaminicus]|uniref:MazG-like family protein n=1 Tax=Streptomyces triculaminicus TaxID=2816232 RepID=UPI0037BC55BE
MPNAHLPHQPTARDAIRAILGDDPDNLLIQLETEVRAEAADELRRAPLPTVHDNEQAQTARTVRSVDTRLVAQGMHSDYWIPATTEATPLAPLWDVAHKSTAWLDTANGSSDHETAMRLMKICEEAGEVMAAYIGMTGQNPRKGVTHRRSDVAAELCDVIITAATALHAFTKDPAAALDDHARRISQRIG